jgi:hypothetical protein
LAAVANGNRWCMDQAATVTPARALARFMVVAFAAVLMTLVLTVVAVGVASPVNPSGAAPATPTAATTP